MKKSKKIRIKLKELSKEKKELIKHLQPVPEGYYKRQFIGYRTEFTNGSLIDAIRGTLDNQENATYRRVLTYQNKPITKEGLNEIRSKVIQENKPYEKRIKEIDELIPILKGKLAKAIANELLETSVEETDMPTSGTDKSSLSEYGELKEFIEIFIKTSEFLKLNIPKHQTLKANHRIGIEKLLHKKYSNYKINLKSFYTELKRLDYSKPRKK